MKAKVILTDNFRRLAEEGLNRTERGRLAYTRFRELAETGRLSKATSRQELTNLLGFTDELSVSAKNWAYNYIHNGYVQETLLGISNGRALYNYTVGNKVPNWYRAEHPLESSPAEMPQVEPQREKPEQAPSQAEVIPAKTGKSVYITASNMSVSVEGYAINDVLMIIKELKNENQN